MPVFEEDDIIGIENIIKGKINGRLKSSPIEMTKNMKNIIENKLKSVGDDLFLTTGGKELRMYCHPL